jgi:hypothetical protein
MDWSRSRRFTTLHVFISAVLTSPALVAGPIEPWQGGSAEVHAVGDQSSQQGTHADVSAAGQTHLYYSSVYDSDPNAFSVEARGSAHAQVLGAADALLRVNASYGVDNPGTQPRGFHSDVSTLTTAQASWIGDRIHIGPNANGTIPDSIRVGVTVTLSNPDGWIRSYDPPRSGTVDLQVGGRHIQVSGWSENRDLTGWLVSLGFDSAKGITTPGYPGIFFSYQAKVFLDLAVDAQGWTDPFDLSLKSSVSGLPGSNEGLLMAPGAFTLGLDDITLSDGTSVTAAGYNVAFDSGLAWPVPEPASAACWAALVAAAVGVSRKRARRAVAGD